MSKYIVVGRRAKKQYYLNLTVQQFKSMRFNLVESNCIEGISYEEGFELNIDYITFDRVVFNDGSYRMFSFTEREGI